MKKLLVGMICSLIFACVFTSCDWFKHHTKVTGSFPIFGIVTATPQTSKNGDAIQLSIEEAKLLISVETSVNGKELKTTITYFIDGEKVAESTDRDNKYQCTYTVKGLSVGYHEITAHCTTNFKGYDVEEHLTSGKLEIVE